ncbi:Multicopper oxidase, type 1 [Sesbania bispinosa]|nr:Multicopper oxidase, type 1 [Sesbania bispinosa]
MGSTGLVHVLYLVLALVSVSLVQAEDAYKFYTWTVILINGQFPGPRLDLVTNDNVILNLINKLDEPFLLTWNGIKQRKNSWQDGVLGTNCPIPPNSNYTYKFQTKDQIGTYTYFPSTKLHKASGGFGGLNVYHRSVIPIPYPNPDGDFTLLIGDWYKTSHKILSQSLDSGKSLAFPDGLLINGQAHSTFSANQGKTYMFRISNVGLSTSINFRIQGHKLKLVEVEGSHTIQNLYDSLDVHVGQSVAVLCYTMQILIPQYQDPCLLHLLKYDWSMQQARTYRWNLTANAARPNPQGSFHYGKITPTKIIKLANSAPLINGKLRYAVNMVSYVNPDTPLKLADYFNIPGVFSMNSLQSTPSNGPAYVATSVLPTSLHDFIEVVFQNNENTTHLGILMVMIFGLLVMVSASGQKPVEVYPNSWTTILVSLDNQGMWNLRSAIWERQYLGQQFYLRVWNAQHSLANEYDIPNNALLCGKAVGHHP